jgi:hypothetical protein
VRLLDVAALQSVYIEGSIFDPGYLEQLSLWKFMGRLSERITMPVMPDDEPTEYLITQMIADYLARQPAPGLDGILFSSVQSPGEHRNVVLFHHASRVEALDIPEGTKLSAHQTYSTEDGDEVDYRVWEEVPTPEPPKAKGAADDFNWDVDVSWDQTEKDYREATLRVLTGKIAAHHITGVTFATDEFKVDRTRMEKKEWKFAASNTVDLSDLDF